MQSLSDVHRPTLPIVWEKGLELPVFEIPEGARTFAREGAKVFLSGRTLGKVERVAEEIRAAGGAAEAFRVDALDEQAVEEHVASVFQKTGRLDVCLNGITAVPQPGTQGVPIAQLPVDAFVAPITLYMRSHFLTARAAARIWWSP